MRRVLCTLEPIVFWLSVGGCLGEVILYKVTGEPVGWVLLTLAYLVLWKLEARDHAATQRKLESGWIGGPPTGGIVKAIGKNGSLWVQI